MTAEQRRVLRSMVADGEAAGLYRVQELEARLAAVLALHVQRGGPTVRREMCRECNDITWPCATRRACGVTS